jgi:RHS repeat-associated protein
MPGSTGYTGRELDAETGLYYYRARYYDAQTGQFIGQDPLSFGAGDSNLYRYVANNATNLTDPSGLFSFDDAKRWARDRYNDGRKAVSDGINTAGYGIKGTADFYRNKDNVDNAYENIRPVIISRAEESRDRYVDTYNDPNANPLLRFGAGVGGSLTSLAAEDNYDTTKNILEGALLVDGVIQIGRALPGVIKNCKKWIKSPKTLGTDIANIFKNKPKTVESNITKITDKCFVAGTLILTGNGKKPIEDLRTGDWIVSWDEETGEVIERPVTEWFRREAPAIIDIFIGVEKISCTIDHPFWVEGKGWVLASQIKQGTVLRDREGNLLTVDVVRRHDEVTSVYNIEIEGLHTYFVSELEILSHNACGGKLIGAITDLEPQEVEFVNRLLSQGKNVEVVPRSSLRTPDFIIDGVRTELKTISGVQTLTSDAISSATSNRIMNARGQAGHILVDATQQPGMTEDIARRGIGRAYGADNRLGSKIQSITVEGPGFSITIPRI